MWKWLLISICVIGDVLLAWACCKVSGDADREAQRMYHQYIKSQLEDNNNQNNEGE